MIIKLNAIDSTNDFLKRMLREEKLPDYTMVLAGKQTKGRGQMGTSWQTEPYKNLISSTFKNIECLGNTSHFLVTMAVSVAVIKTLELFEISNLAIKWPNDILSANQKICGILIETIIKGGRREAAIIGVGLNVNQLAFPGLDRATSIKLQTGKEYDPVTIADELLKNLKGCEHLWFTDKKWTELENLYLSYLFRLHKPSAFERANGERFSGSIEGVATDGKLKILLENERTEEFDLKEVKLLY